MKKLIPLLSFLFIWQLSAMVLSNNIFPPPTAVLQSLVQHAPEVLKHCGFSIYRLVLGICCALFLGLPLGIALAYYQNIGAFATPIIYVMSAVPKVALLPILMLCFGIGNGSKIVIIFLIVVFQIIVTVFNAVRNIPAEYFVYFKSLHASDIFIIKNLIVRMVLAEIFTAVRIGLATSISVLFFAETFGTRFGLGFYVMDMWMRFDYVQMYGGIFMLGMVGLLLLFFVDTIERKVCFWKKFQDGCGEKQKI
jgi:NitT/TauT family transport system permease protein